MVAVNLPKEFDSLVDWIRSKEEDLLSLEAIDMWSVYPLGGISLFTEEIVFEDIVENLKRRYNHQDADTVVLELKQQLQEYSESSDQGSLQIQFQEIIQVGVRKLIPID